jgi:hypothetical protein
MSSTRKQTKSASKSKSQTRKNIRPLHPSASTFVSTHPSFKSIAQTQYEKNERDLRLRTAIMERNKDNEKMLKEATPVSKKINISKTTTFIMPDTNVTPNTNKSITPDVVSTQKCVGKMCNILGGRKKRYTRRARRYTKKRG